MRIRLRGPAGATTISLADTATVGELKSQIQAGTGLGAYDLKTGYPPVALGLDGFSNDTVLADTGLKLDGQQIIVSSREVAAAADSVPVPPSKAREESSKAASYSRPRKPPQPAAPNGDDPPEIPMLGMQGTLVLRVMPDDNSCLFRALSYAVLGDVDQMHELRATVARVIEGQPDVYTEAVLDKPVDEYCDWIQRPSSWGGAVEMSILSIHFGLEIISINVEDLRIDRFNEGQPNRCILVYSGIHYDCIALNPSDWPFTRANGEPEDDQRMFAAADDAAVEGALALCKILKERNYFVNTNTFQVLCNLCGWKGKGEKEAIKHAESTGHYDFGQS